MEEDVARASCEVGDTAVEEVALEGARLEEEGGASAVVGVAVVEEVAMEEVEVGGAAAPGDTPVEAAVVEEAAAPSVALMGEDRPVRQQPTGVQLVSRVRQVLNAQNINTTAIKALRLQLEEHFNCQLKHRLPKIKECVLLVGVELSQ